MILEHELTLEQRLRSQRNINAFNAINGFSYMCVGETIMILLALKLGFSDVVTAVLGGMYAFKSGLDKRAEIKVHAESLKQLGDSFQSEVQPMVVDVEGRTLQLKGSAEEQYAEWRQLLRELYEDETGMPAAPGIAAAGAAPPPGTP